MTLSYLTICGCSPYVTEAEGLTSQGSQWLPLIQNPLGQPYACLVHQILGFLPCSYMETLGLVPNHSVSGINGKLVYWRQQSINNLHHWLGWIVSTVQSVTHWFICCFYVHTSRLLYLHLDKGYAAYFIHTFHSVFASTCCRTSGKNLSMDQHLEELIQKPLIERPRLNHQMPGWNLALALR